MATQNIEESVTANVQTAPRFPDALEDAYQRRLEEIKAVPDDEIFRNTLDVHASVTTILGALPEIRALREAMGRLPQLDVELVDALEDYAKATGQAHSLYTIAMTPLEDIVALNEAATKEREVLRVVCLALATRGLLDRGRLASFKGLVGYKNVAFDLIDYANLLKECWPAIEGRSGLSLEDVAEAKDLGLRLAQAAGFREQAPLLAADVLKVRQQALTLMVRAYDEVRRAVFYLRWKEGDADSIAPSLYAGRGGKGSTDPADPQPAEPAPAPAAGGAAPATGAATPGAGAAATAAGAHAPATGAAALATGAAAPATGATAPAPGAAAPATGAPAPAVPIAQGLPGARPFVV